MTTFNYIIGEIILFFEIDDSLCMPNDCLILSYLNRSTLKNLSSVSISIQRDSPRNNLLLLHLLHLYCDDKYVKCKTLIWLSSTFSSSRCCWLWSSENAIGAVYSAALDWPLIINTGALERRISLVYRSSSSSIRGVPFARELLERNSTRELLPILLVAKVHVSSGTKTKEYNIRKWFDCVSHS